MSQFCGLVPGTAVTGRPGRQKVSSQLRMVAGLLALLLRKTVCLGLPAYLCLSATLADTDNR